MKIKLLSACVLLVMFVSCKKEKGDSGTDPGTVVSAADKVKDTSLAIAKDLYLWYSKIPSSFNARSYDDPNKIMEAIRAYSIEPGFASAVDRWSFGVKQSVWDDVSGGIAKDFGLNVFFRAEGDLRVRVVEPSSPAGLAGVKRGWRITKLNGSTNITTGNADAIVTAVYESTSTNFTFLKPDGNSVDISLTGASYNEKQIMLDSVYTVDTKKVGYMVYNSFLGDSATTVNGFKRVFERFMAESVNDVVIDLRYNGGGYVYFQNELANYLINNAGNGNIMMKTKYNDNYSQYNFSSNFAKKGTLNLSRIFFIVSSNTASASELLINNLKPYMTNVYLIGPSKTYGKPVGYFAVPVGDWYVFPVSSRTVNKNEEGSYFGGFSLNSTVSDGIDKDWGDITETCLASALKFIGTGGFRMPAQQEYVEEANITKSNVKLAGHDFKGMIDKKRF